MSLRSRYHWWRLKRTAIAAVRSRIAAGESQRVALDAVVLELRRAWLDCGLPDPYPHYLRALADEEEEAARTNSAAGGQGVVE